MKWLTSVQSHNIFLTKYISGKYCTIFKKIQYKETLNSDLLSPTLAAQVVCPSQGQSHFRPARVTWVASLAWLYVVGRICLLLLQNSSSGSFAQLRHFAFLILCICEIDGIRPGIFLTNIFNLYLTQNW